MLDAYKKGRMKRGEESGTSKLKNSDIFRIRKLRKNGFSEKEIAEEIGTTRSNIGNILQGNTWKHI
jgi:transcriptional regulator